MEDKVIIITAPSGAGKTTLVKLLLEKNENLAFSVSACTRGRRENEIEGKDYYFMNSDTFQNKILEDAFIEYEEVYPGNYYGTLKTEIENLWVNNKIVVFDIDVQGAMRIKRKLKEKALSIFIKPPSKEILIKRLKDRKTETDEMIQRRIDKADKELNYVMSFDYCVVNDSLEVAYAELEGIVHKFIYQGIV